MEPIIVIVGFLGAGKTTLLKKLIQSYLAHQKKPFIILNDYQNAYLDSQQFLEFLDPPYVQSLSGSCICCSGIVELRNQVNSIPRRENGVTLIEANGTSDSCALMSFLGVGLNEHFLPPIQISVVDVKQWQKRQEHNELEANQVQVSSLIILNHHTDLDLDRLQSVKNELTQLNPWAKQILWDDLTLEDIRTLTPSLNQPDDFEHGKTHWSSCSVDLPLSIPLNSIHHILSAIPDQILRVKGCTRVDHDQGYTYFERVPSGEVKIRPYYGSPITGPKLLTIGPGSDPELLQKVVEEALQK